jgi:hypothetical protein
VNELRDSVGFPVGLVNEGRVSDGASHAVTDGRPENVPVKEWCECVIAGAVPVNEWCEWDFSEWEKLGLPVGSWRASMDEGGEGKPVKEPVGRPVKEGWEKEKDTVGLGNVNVPVKLGNVPVKDGRLVGACASLSSREEGLVARGGTTLKDPV